MTAQEFGDLIREQRLASGLAIDEVASRIKLSAKTLQALEEGDFSLLPHEVYARSFVKAYARAVGLSDGLIEEGLAELFPVESHVVTPEPADRPAGGKRFIDRLLVALIVFVAVVLPLTAGYFVVTNYGSDILNSAKKALSAARMGSGPETSAPVNATLAEQAQVEPEPAPLEATLAEHLESPLAETTTPASTVETAPVEPETVASAQHAPAVPDRAAEAPVSAAADHVLAVAATDACWMEVVSDGQRREMIIQPGETLNFPFTRSLTITLGNAGGVSFSYDGKAFPISTRSGEVKRYVFPPSS